MSKEPPPIQQIEESFHPDTSPKKLPLPSVDTDQLRPSMVYPKNTNINLKIMQSTPEGDKEVEYGSNTQRVMNLEAKYGGYTMTSDIFNYEELKKNHDFKILRFKDAIYRGQILHGERREGFGIMQYENSRLYEG